MQVGHRTSRSAGSHGGDGGVGRAAAAVANENTTGGNHRNAPSAAGTGKRGAQGGAKFGGLYDDAKNGGDLLAYSANRFAPRPRWTKCCFSGLPRAPSPRSGYACTVGRAGSPSGFSDGGPVRVPASAPVGVVAIPPGTAGFSPAAGRCRRGFKDTATAGRCGICA